MHVHDSLNKPHFSPQSIARSADNVARKGESARAADVETSVGSGESATHTAAPEVIQLLDRLRDLPEVREEVITEVTERLLKGVYLTRVAAEEAANAIVEN